MKSMISVFICVVILFCGSTALAEEAGFKIIVNASNPSEALSPKDISKLFLKKVTTWKLSGEKVEPVDLVENASLREVFSEEIHGRKISSIKSYWQKQIFSGRGVPPLEKESEQEILQFIEKNVGAIGYVSVKTDIDAHDVKVLEVVD